MPRPRSNFPTSLELMILKILWEEQPLVVREIRDKLAELGRDIAHTSVITTLNIMVAKKFLKRKRDGKSYSFSTKVIQDQVSNGIVSDVVERVFDGSTRAMMLNLLDISELDTNELNELRQMINRKVRERSKGTSNDNA